MSKMGELYAEQQEQEMHFYRGHVEGYHEGICDFAQDILKYIDALKHTSNNAILEYIRFKCDENINKMIGI